MACKVWQHIGKEMFMTKPNRFNSHLYHIVNIVVFNNQTSQQHHITPQTTIFHHIYSDFTLIMSNFALPWTDYNNNKYNFRLNRNEHFI